MILARATQSVIGFTDALLIAPLGQESLAAVTTGALNTFAFIILPMGTVFIVQSFAAQLRGRGELSSVKRYAVYGLLLSLLAGLFALLALPFVDSLLGALGFVGNVRTLMAQYVAIRLLSVAPAVGMEALGNWYGGLGNTRMGMIAAVVTMLANLLGAYLFIQPHFGMPGYGVAGAAWASVASSTLGFLVIGFCFVRGVGYEAMPSSLALRASELLRTLRFGLPNGVNWFLEFSAFVLFINIMVGHLGTATLAAFNVVLQLNSIAFMPAFGLASAGAIMVGEAIGGSAQERVWPIVKMTALVAGSFMSAVGVFYLCFSDPIMRLFADNAESAAELAEIGGAMLGLSALWQLFDALGLTFGEALRAAGDTTWTMIARIVLAWFVFMPLGYAAVFVYSGGVVGVMGAIIVYILLIAFALSARFATGRWRSIDLVGEPQLV